MPPKREALRAMRAEIDRATLSALDFGTFDYFDAVAALRKLAKRYRHNTCAVCYGGHVSLYLHQTPIVSITREGVIVLAHGGYTTRTTQARTNQALNALGLVASISRAGRDCFALTDPHTGLSVEVSDNGTRLALLDH